jgi:uncharacterized damage-inducible protein DinB
MELATAFVETAREFLKDYLNLIAACMEELNEPDIWWRENEQSNSIGNLILHVSGSLGQWIVSGIGGADDHRIRQQEFDERSEISKQDLFSKLSSTFQTADRVLAQIDPERLSEKLQLFGKEVTWMYAIFHMIEHVSMHTGQIIFITKVRTAKDLRLQ